MSDRGTEGEPGRLGRYELLTRLATGGMGEIFLARLAGDGGFEKLVVIKRLLEELGDSEPLVAMFRDEARIAARLSHPNVCEVYELGQHEGRYYIAMQYLEGLPYARLMQPGDDAAAHARLVAGLLTQACEGLHHAHEARGADGQVLGVVHRDVSPSNLFVTTTGVLKVLDFGIAKARGASALTTRGTIKGTYQYMSPEQVRGDALDRRSDLFALGVVLHESLTGERMFDRSSDYLIAKAIIEEPVPRLREHWPEVPAALEAVAARALAREPARRFDSARELGRALAEAVAGLGGPLAATEIAELLEERHGEDLRTQRQRHREATSAARPAHRTVPFAAPSKAPATAPAKAPATAATRSLGPTAPRPRRAGRALAIAGVALAMAAAVVAGLVLRNGAPADRAIASSRDGAATNPLPHSGGGDRGGGREEDPGLSAPAPADAGRDSSVARAAAAHPHPAPPPPAGEGDRRQRTAGEGQTGTNDRQRPARAAEATREPGRLSIDSSPYATIYIDGERAGVTPMIRRSLAPGRHRIRAVLEDGRDQAFSVVIEAGKDAPPQKLSW